MPIALNCLFLRSTWLKIHLYLALSVGFLFALMGLTGSLCIYREALDNFFNPQLVITEPQDKIQSLDRIFGAVQKAHPNRHGSWTLEMPQSSPGMITAWYDKPQETFFDFHAPLMVSINPYTAEVTSSRFWGKTLTTWLMDMHTQFRLDGFGWTCVGLLGGLLLISVGSGIYLWWSGFTAFFTTFKIRSNTGQRTFIFDVHRLIGFISAPILLILAFTGINLSYPQVLATLTGSSGMGHGETGRIIISTADPTKHPTTLAGAVFVARSAFPKAELRRIATPVGDTGVYRINFRQSSEVNQRHPFTTVWVDHWSGQIKEIRNPVDFSIGESVVSWIWPMHTGEAFGAKGRFLWFVAGLGLFVLYVTGLLLWLYRTGRLLDKAVNLEPLRVSVVRLKIKVQQLNAALQSQVFCMGRRLITDAPKYKLMCLKLWHRLRSKVLSLLHR